MRAWLIAAVNTPFAGFIDVARRPLATGPGQSRAVRCPKIPPPGDSLPGQKIPLTAALGSGKIEFK
jgi:hypothetical protein